MLVLLLFFLSGATALVYEVIWSKYLALMFGSTVQAQTVVLAVFMGGLALGNRIFGKRAARLKQPLAAYGYIELVIGLYAFFYHTLYTFADGVFVSVGAKFVENSAALLALKGALSLGLLIAPTILMGGTLPLLAGWLERRVLDAGKSSALFYSVNSLGAVFGSAVAGFYLVRNWGMLSSLQMAAFVNLLVAGTAILISRREGDLEHEREHALQTRAVPLRTALTLVTVTGAVSMGLEVLGSRAVALVVGGSLQAFAIVLMAFILGIGLGAAVVAAFPKRQTTRAMFALLIGASTAIWFFVWRVEDWIIFYTEVRSLLAENKLGYGWHQFSVAAMAMLALGAPAGMLGAVLPIAIRQAGGENLGDQVGRLLTWNTFGAVAGVLLTGFVLMPHAGMRASFLILALTLAIIGAIGAFRAEHRGLATCGSCLALAAAISFWGGENWRYIFASGIFRIRGLHLTYADISKMRDQISLRFYKDGPDASVAVGQIASTGAPQQLILRINGKADASTHGDLPTQYLLAHLPLAARPESKDVFILGFGSGITGGAVLGHPIESLTVAENCGPVLEAAPLFGPWNRGVLTNARTHVRREDARTVLKLSEKQYDVIISEPSNPWVAGVGSVFTQEFYRLCASRLKPGGIMTQWFHIYEMHDGIVDLVLNTFASVFPNMEVWEPENGDIILLGSAQPWDSSPAAFQKLFDRAEVKRDFEAIGLPTAVQALAKQLASQRTAFAIPSGTAIQSDEFPVLEYAAPEAFFEARSAERVFLFDERTRQSALAPEVKRRTLRALPEQAIHSAFSEFGTANVDLLRYLKWRAEHVRNSAAHPVYDVDPALPIIFRPPDSFSLTATNQSPLLVAQMEIAKDPDNAVEAIQRIEADLSAPQAAASAARACIVRGERDRAAKLVARGLALAPTDDELKYLQRLLSRIGK